MFIEPDDPALPCWLLPSTQWAINQPLTPHALCSKYGDASGSGQEPQSAAASQQSPPAGTSSRDPRLANASQSPTEQPALGAEEAAQHAPGDMLTFEFPLSPADGSGAMAGLAAYGSPAAGSRPDISPAPERLQSPILSPGTRSLVSASAATAQQQPDEAENPSTEAAEVRSPDGPTAAAELAADVATADEPQQADAPAQAQNADTDAQPPADVPMADAAEQPAADALSLEGPEQLSADHPMAEADAEQTAEPPQAAGAAMLSAICNAPVLSKHLNEEACHILLTNNACAQHAPKLATQSLALCNNCWTTAPCTIVPAHLTCSAVRCLACLHCGNRGVPCADSSHDQPAVPATHADAKQSAASPEPGPTPPSGSAVAGAVSALKPSSGTSHFASPMSSAGRTPSSAPALGNNPRSGSGVKIPLSTKDAARREALQSLFARHGVRN